MLALEIIGVLILAGVALLFYRHIQLLSGNKDSNNPVQHTPKLPPHRVYALRDHFPNDDQFGYSSPLLDSVMEELLARRRKTQTARDRRQQLFQSKQDIRRAYIINELLNRPGGL